MHLMVWKDTITHSYYTETTYHNRQEATQLTAKLKGYNEDTSHIATKIKT